MTIRMIEEGEELISIRMKGTKYVVTGPDGVDHIVQHRPGETFDVCGITFSWPDGYERKADDSKTE